MGTHIGSLLLGMGMTRLCNNCTHDVFAFGVVHYIKRGINVMGPSTTRSSSPSHVDGRPTERSADCSTAFPARVTPVRPHELSSRHVSRRHDTLAVSTTYCRLTYLYVQLTVQLSSPCVTPERPRQPSS